MEICATCATKLDPSWKFCIKCGTPVPAGAAHQSRDEQNVVDAAVPAAATTPIADPVAPTASAPTRANAPAPAPAESTTRKPRRAKSRFEPKTSAIPIITIPAKPAAEIQAEEPADAAITYELTPESALAEPALPDSVVHGTGRAEPSQSRGPHSDPSRLGQAREEYARAEREAAQLAEREHEASERARAEREPAERVLAERVETERLLAELHAAEQSREERDDHDPAEHDFAESAAGAVSAADAIVPVHDDDDAALASALAEPAAALLPAEAKAAPLVVTNENPFAHNLPPRPFQPQSRAEAKAAAAARAVARARNTAAAKAEIRAKYPIPSASAKVIEQEYTDDTPAAFRAADGPLSKRKVDLPLVVSISLATAGVILIVYLAILVFGARG